MASNSSISVGTRCSFACSCWLASAFVAAAVLDFTMIQSFVTSFLHLESMCARSDHHFILLLCISTDHLGLLTGPSMLHLVSLLDWIQRLFTSSPCFFALLTTSFCPFRAHPLPWSATRPSNLGTRPMGVFGRL